VRRRIPQSETLAREYLANERTLLSWLRTGTSSIALGILLDTVARTLNALEILPPDLQQNRLVLFSLALVAFGAAVNVLTAARFVQYRFNIRQGILTSSAGLTLLVVFSLVFLSVAYVVYVAVA
jgi:putative membrane protein